MWAVGWEPGYTQGRSLPGRYGSLVCFAGQGPGEVFVEERKIVGVSQWRGREGALFRGCAYTPSGILALLVDLLEVDPAPRRDGARVDDLPAPPSGVEDLIAGCAPVPDGRPTASPRRAPLVRSPDLGRGSTDPRRGVVGSVRTLGLSPGSTSALTVARPFGRRPLRRTGP